MFDLLLDGNGSQEEKFWFENICSSTDEFLARLFILSDDAPFTDDEIEIFKGIERVSLGETWLQGHACISIIHHQLDLIA